MNQLKDLTGLSQVSICTLKVIERILVHLKLKKKNGGRITLYKSGFKYQLYIRGEGREG